MAETLNPTPFCRCCHKNGDFKCLFSNHIYENQIENYSQMLYDTFGILFVPSIDDKIYTICDECIEKLCISTEFKNCVLACKKNACWRGHCCAPLDGGSAVTPDVKQNCSGDEDSDMDMINKVLEELSNEEVKVEESADKSDETFSECEEYTADLDVKSEESVDDEDSCIDKVSDKDVTIEESGKNKESMSESGVNLRNTSDRHENKCNICNKTFERKGNLEKHLRTHEIYKCKICPEILSNQIEYDKHMEIHPGGIKHECKECGRTLATKRNLLRHYQNMHNMSIKKV